MTTMDNPTQRTRFEVAVWSLLIGIVIGWLARGGCTSQTEGQPRAVGSPHVEMIVEHDTVYRTRPQIVVREAPARVRVQRVPVIVYVDSSTTDDGTRYDTLSSRPFTAQADTIVGNDTIEQRFDFPPPRLSVVVRQGPDSIITQRDIITVTQDVDRPRPWYEEPAKALLWMSVGYGIRVLTAPSR